MKYHGCTVIVTNAAGAQKIGIDSLSADLLLRRMKTPAIVYMAQLGDTITITPYTQATTWSKIFQARLITWMRYRRAVKRLKQRGGVGIYNGVTMTAPTDTPIPSSDAQSKK